MLKNGNVVLQNLDGCGIQKIKFTICNILSHVYTGELCTGNDNNVKIKYSRKPSNSAVLA